MNAAPMAWDIHRARLKRIADILAIGLVVVLPWSTSLTWILLGLWLAALLPTLTLADLRRELMTPACGFPVLLWLLAAIGMLWADIPWRERFDGLGGFHKLLMFPFLIAQFRRSESGMRVVAGFFASMMLVLVVSWTLALAPGLPWRGDPVGVPIRDYIWQSGAFLLCAFALLGVAVDLWPGPRRRSAVMLAALIVALLANIAFVATGRTTLVVATVFFAVFGFWWFSWKRAIAVIVVGALIGVALSASSQYLRDRLTATASELDDYQAKNLPTSAGLRLEYITKSVNFIMAAPVIGHGTGSTEDLFRRAATGEEGASAHTSVNPHNQILAVGTQLGIAGAIVLSAMWIAHLMLFRGGGLVGWFGTLVVVQNIVASLFNSHLVDFTQGWIYVFGVGVLGGMALRRADASPGATVQTR